MGFHTEQRDYDVVIVGAGPAGLGVGAALARLEQVNFVVLEREAVGAIAARDAAYPREAGHHCLPLRLHHRLGRLPTRTTIGGNHA